MDNNIDGIFKNIIFDLKPEEQRKLLKLYSNYKNIKSYDNYEELEKDIYTRQSVNNDKEKVKFELERIKDFIEVNKIENREIFDRFYFVNKAFIIYSTYGEESIDNGALKDIIESIILLELDLGMRIGLYMELCECFEKEIINSYIKKEKNKDEYKEYIVKGNG